MVGCGGFGAANTGVAAMVRAAAKEPAIVAVAMALFEFIGRSPKIRMLRSRVSTQRRAGGGPENPAARNTS
jgi:hypothetical protein